MHIISGKRTSSLRLYATVLGKGKEIQNGSGNQLDG
jgi:hypothetical protein